MQTNYRKKSLQLVLTRHLKIFFIWLKFNKELIRIFLLFNNM